MPRKATAVGRELLPVLRAAQDDVLTRAQLVLAGYDRHAVASHIRGGRWQRATPSVVILHAGPPTRRQREWVAVLAQNAPAALAGITAAARHGLTGFETDVVHVVIPASVRPKRLPDVRVHVSRRYDGSDIHELRAPPQVRVERALVDAAAWSPSPRRACAILAAGTQQQLTTARRLRAELLKAGFVRHRKLLLAVLGDIEGGAQSLAEIDFSVLARNAGIPPPLHQAVRCDRSGRRRYLDADFGGFSAEVDGAAHLLPIAYWRDMARQNDLVIASGRPILRFPAIALRIDPAAVARQLVDATHRFPAPPER
jgi:hypothetical protein